MRPFTFILKPRPPFRLDLTAWALRRRARNLVDRWDGTTYRRVLVFGRSLMEVATRQVGSREDPSLSVTVTGADGARARAKASQFVTQTLGLESDLAPFYHLARRNKRLRPLVEEFRGIKPPRFPTVFEALVNAIACQQLSLTVGIELLNRTSRECGPAGAFEGATQFGFPGPQDLLRLGPHKLRHLGFSYRKAQSLLELSRQTSSAKIHAGNLALLNNENAINLLSELRGVGRWTAEYVLLRGLGRIDVFPGDDVGARNRLALWLGREGPLDYEGVQRAVRRWHPYAGLVYFHLLLAGLAVSGELVRVAAAA
jgi:DNA-3-methyladenine glycosylase II